MSETESAVKPNSLDLPVQNGTIHIEDRGDVPSKILNGVGFGHYELSPVTTRLSPSSLSHGKNGFFVSFMVDARGGVHKGRRHSGVDVHIPAHRVCQPTRITCKLIKRDKATSLPKLGDGENLASRVIETGPVHALFTGPVQLDVPHFASLRDGEREIVVMRSDDGINWYQHINTSPTDNAQPVNDEAADDDDDAHRQVVKIYTSDFPRYFVAVTRLYLDSAVVGSKGSTLKSSVVPQVQAVFNQRSVNKDTKIGLQVLPVQNDVIQRCLGRIIPVSPITTIEPRRRRFHEPINLTIPIPRGATLPTPKTKPTAQSLKILYSISGGSTPPQWEDITGSAALNIVNQTLSFATTLSARFWLLDCINVAEPVSIASEIYRESIVTPYLARLHVFIKRHTGTRAQVRVLALTDEDVQKTFEVTEGFTEIASSDVVEVLEGKPYYLHLEGGLSLTATPSVQPSLMFHAFHVNRLSFIVRCSAQQSTSGTLSFSKQRSTGTDPSSAGGDNVRGQICSIPITVAAYEGEEIVSPAEEPEIYQQRFEAAVSSAAATKATVQGSAAPPPPPIVAGGVDGLRLGEVGRALHGDWVPLSSLLGITQREVVKIQSEFGDTEEQAMIMLHLWVEKAGVRATSAQLESALKRIGREDLLVANRPPSVNNATTPDSGEVNPIDSPLNPDDVARVLDFDTSERSMLFDAEPGAVYEIEQVWDGKDWTKTKRLSKAVDQPEDEEIQQSTEIQPTAAVPVVSPSELLNQNTDESSTNGETAVHGVTLESLPHEHDDKQMLDDTIKSLSHEHHDEPQELQQRVDDTLESLPHEHHDEPQEFQKTVGNTGAVDEPDSVEEDLRSSEVPDVGQRPKSLDLNTENIPVIQIEGEPETQLEGEPALQIEGQAGIPAIQIDGEPVEDVDIEETEEVLEDGTIVRRKITTTHKVCPSLTVTTPDGSKILDESAFDGLAGSTADEILISKTSTVDGDPTVTTEVEETEEVSEDGTVIKRKLIKTHQQQSVTTSVVVQGPEGSDLDKVTEAILKEGQENSNASHTDGKKKKQQQKKQKKGKK